MTVGVSAAPADPPDAGRVLQIVAHPDDDLCFMDPDLRYSMAAGRPVTSVHLTSGEAEGINAGAAGEATTPPDKAAYAEARQNGIRSACAGSPVERRFTYSKAACGRSRCPAGGSPSGAGPGRSVRGAAPGCSPAPPAPSWTRGFPPSPWGTAGSPPSARAPPSVPGPGTTGARWSRPCRRAPARSRRSRAAHRPRRHGRVGPGLGAAGGGLSGFGSVTASGHLMAGRTSGGQLWGRTSDGAGRGGVRR